MAFSPFSPQVAGGGGSPFSPFSAPATASGGLPTLPGKGQQSQVNLNDATQLLALAEAHGGSIESLAHEIMNPQASLMSRITHGFAQAFSGFVKVISTPSNIVAAGLSHLNSNPEDDLTIGEAIRKGVSPSAVLFGEMQSDSSAMHKVGSYVARFATDILLDPLTYVTFGAGEGLLGIRATSEVALGTQMVKKATIEGGRLVTREVEEQVVKNLSKEGQGLFLRAVEMQKNGLTNTVRKEFFSRAGVAEGSEAAANLLRDGSKELDLLIGQTLEAKLDRKFVLDTMGKMISTGTRDSAGNVIHSTEYLAQTFIDQGGIKVFGKSILSGQRISAAVELVPGFTAVDLATQPFRNALKSVFNPAVDRQFGALPKEYVALRQTARDLFESGKIKDVTVWMNTVKAFNMTNDEAVLLGAAIEAGKIPADSRLQNAFIMVKGLTSKRELNKLREAGVYVSENANYVTHLLVDNESRTVGKFASAASGTSNAAKEAKIAKFVDVSTGKEMVGTPEKLGLSKFVTKQEVEKVQAKLVEFVKDKEGAMAGLTADMQALMHGVDEAFQGRATAQFQAILDALPIDDQENLKALVGAFKTRLPVLDVPALVNARAGETLKEGVRVAQEATEGLSEAGVEALEKRVTQLKARMAKGEGELAGDVESINKALADYKPTEKVSVKGLTAEAEADGVVENLRATAAAVKDESRNFRARTVDKALDEKSMAQFVTSLADEFARNPVGARRLMDSIIGKEQKLRDLVEDVAFERLSAKKALDELPDSAFVYRDAEGATYERARASIAEIKEAGFDGFEENVVVAGVARSIENTKAAVMTTFLRDVARVSGKPVSEAQSGWRTVSVKALKQGERDFSDFVRSASGEELAFHPGVAKDLESFVGSVINDETTRMVMQKFDKLQNLFKASVTSIFPQFHFRNGLSNVFLNFMDLGTQALNPSTHATAAWLVTEDRILNREARKLAELEGMVDRRIGQARPVVEGAAKAKPVAQDFAPAIDAVSEMGTFRLSQLKAEMREEFGDPLKQEIRDMFKGLQSDLGEEDLAAGFGFEQAGRRGSKLTAKYGDRELNKDSSLFQQMLNFGEKEGARKSGATGGVKAEIIDLLDRKFSKSGVPASKWVDRLVDSGLWDKLDDIPYPMEAKDHAFWKGVFKRYQGTDRSKGAFLKALTGEEAPAAAGLEARNVMRRYNMDDVDALWHRIDGLVPDAAKVTPETRAAREQVLAAGQEELDVLRAQNQARLRKTVFTDRTGYPWSLGELRGMVKDMEVAFSPFISGAIDIRTPAKEMTAELFLQDKNVLMRAWRKGGNPFSENFAPWRGGREIGRAVEEQARLVNFVANLKATGDPVLAAQRTKQFLFDYNNLTDFEKTFMRRLVPFYTFTRKNIEGQVRALLTTPGRTAAQLRAVHTVGDMIGGAQLSDKDRAKLPTWLAKGLNLVTRRKGQNVELLNSLGTPLEAAFTSMQPNQLLSSISPLLKVPVELSTGWNAFQMKPLKDTDKALAFKHAPKFLKDYIGYQETEYETKAGETVREQVALRPSRMYFLMNLPPTSRILQEIGSLSDERKTTAGGILEQTTGFKYYDFDLDVEELKRNKELVKRMQEALVKANVIASYQNVYVPKGADDGKLAKLPKLGK